MGSVVAGGKVQRSENSKSGLSEQVYAFVKEQLLDGQYGPNDWILVDQISARLSVSRQPVMDGLKRLAVAGLVTIVPQVGCRPRRYNVEEAVDFYRLFAEGEALLAGFAAERAERNDLVKLRIISSEISELVGRKKQNPAELGRFYRSLNNVFHGQLHRMARSPTVSNTVEIQRDLSDFFVAVAERPIFGNRLTEAHDEHERIIKAVSAGDSARASKIMRGHVLAIADRLRAP